MSGEYGLKFVVNGEDYDKIKKSLNEQIEDLQQKVEQLENIIKEAIEYMDRRDLEWGSEEHNTMLNILNKGSESND